MKSFNIIELLRTKLGIRFLIKRFYLPRYLMKPLRITNSPLDFFRRKALAKNIKLDPNALNCVKKLNEFGFSRITFDPILTKKIISLGQQTLSTLDASEISLNKKSQINLIKPNDTRFIHYQSPIIQIASDPLLLKIVAKYLGTAPFVEQIKIVYSPVRESDFKYSELWHVDRQNNRSLKLFMNLVEVTERNGPLTFVDKNVSTTIPPRRWLAGHFDDNEMKTYLSSQSDPQCLTGPAGTSLLIDTDQCFHFGSRCLEPRLILIVNYTSGFSYVPRDPRVGKTLASIPGLKPPLEKIQKYALGI